MKKQLLVIALAFTSLSTNAQIAKPSGYKKITYKAEGSTAQHVSNGRYEISIYALARDMSSDDKDSSLQEGLEMSFHDSKYTKTTDDLYVGTGQQKSGLYYYTIYVPETWQKVCLTSKFNDKQFSANSKWILNQVRKNRKNIYFK